MTEDMKSKEEILDIMVDEMPYTLSEYTKPYIKEAMDIWSKQQSIAYYTWRNSLDGSYEYALGRALTEEEYYDFFNENKFPKK